MVKEILFKWFGVETPPCATCEVLQRELERAHEEKKHLLDTILIKPKEVQSEMPSKEVLQPRNIPWRVRQQMLESEDRAKADILRRQQETEELEKRMAIGNAAATEGS